MIEREKAIKSVKGRQLEAPELRRLLDYQVGDYVQLCGSVKYSGRSGLIIGIRVFEFKDGKADLAYRVKLSDRKSIEVCAKNMRFLRHSDEMPTE